MKQCIILVIMLLTTQNMLNKLGAEPISKSPKPSNELILPVIFSDHMIMQRDQKITLWGWAKINSLVEITLLSGSKKLSITAQTNSQGKWLTSLPAQKSGNEYQLIVNSNEETITIDNILFGDVWLASGQSNMEWKLGWKVNNAASEIANSRNDDIRFFEVTNALHASEQEQLAGGKWQIASPETAANFSAVAWHFAKRYQAEKKVPVAIIDSTWGGTPAEAWLSLPSLIEVPGYEKQAKNMQNNRQEWQDKFAQNIINETKKWQMIEDDSYYADGKVLSPDFDDSHWQTISLPTDPNKPLSDIVWLRKSFTLNALPNKAEINIGEMNQIGKVFLNGEIIYQEGWQDTTKAVKVPVSSLKLGKNILAMRVINDWDNKVIVGKAEQLWLKLDNNIQNLQGQWNYTNNLEPKLPVVKKYNWQSAVLYNAMIKPLTNYALTGVIWYQGESNADKPQYYAKLFKSLIQDWRIQFQQPELPFLFVQLASFMKEQSDPRESLWAELRQAQREALALPHTGMAVTIDIGDADDIHPRNKADVGKRLWLAAKHLVFNDEVNYSGPVLAAMTSSEVDGKSGLLITFQGKETKIQHTGNEIQGFAIAGQDQHYVNGQAKIIGNKVFVYSDKITQPKSVRYGWADNSPANLYDMSLLPAIPFQHSLP